MSEHNDSSGSGYKTLAIVSSVILLFVVVAGGLYWHHLHQTEQQQQQQIDALNQQLADTRTDASQRALAAKDSRIKQLEATNADLQNQLDSSAQTTTSSTTTTTITASP